MLKRSLLFVFLAAGIALAQFEPRIVVSPESYDFGDIKQGETVTKVYTIVNNGNDVLKITKVKASCGCTAAKPDKDELKPGESTELKVSFNSRGRNGKQNKIVYIESNDPKNQKMQVSFTGNVVTASKDGASKLPNIFFKETNHNFGSVNEGKVVDYTFKFTNTGKTTLEIKDVHTSCGCTAALVSSKKIEPGKEGTLRVELDTKNREGKMTRNITISSNDPDEPEKTLTISADVKKES